MLQNYVRVAIIFAGGGTVGLGLEVMTRVRRRYVMSGQAYAARAVVALMAMNFSTLLFVATILFSRWGEPLSWQSAFTVLVFGTKAWFFSMVRGAERQAVREGA